MARGWGVLEPCTLYAGACYTLIATPYARGARLGGSSPHASLARCGLEIVPEVPRSEHVVVASQSLAVLSGGGGIRLPPPVPT